HPPVRMETGLPMKLMPYSRHSAMRLLIVSTSAALVATAAYAQEGWICSYEGYGTKGAPVILRLTVEGTQVRVEYAGSVPGWPPEMYTIVRNSRRALIAFDVFEEEGENVPPEGRQIGGHIVMIDKNTGEFWRNNAILGQLNTTPR